MVLPPPAQMYICDKRSIDCHDCPHAMPHGSCFCFEKRKQECKDAKCITIEKAGWYGNALTTPPNTKPIFVVDQDKLKKTILDNSKEKQIISALTKAQYEKEEFECLKAALISYSDILSNIRKSLVIPESKDILSAIESLKNCSNCDVRDEDQYYPDCPCSRRGCKVSGNTLTGWRNPLCDADDQTITLLSKDDIEEQINETLSIQ